MNNTFDADSSDLPISDEEQRIAYIECLNELSKRFGFTIACELVQVDLATYKAELVIKKTNE